MRKLLVIFSVFLINFVSAYGMGMMDVKVFSDFEKINIASQTPNLNKYNTSSDAIGIFEYDEKVKNYLSSNPDTKSYRVTLLAEAVIIEEKTIVVKSNSGNELRPDIIKININNSFLNLIKTINSRNLDNLGYSIASNVASINERELNKKRNPYKIGDKRFILWTIYQEKGEQDNLNGILVGVFQSKKHAIEFYNNAEDIRAYITKYELEN
jgi:hypothetical protein